ncbi:MAG TPA: glutamate-5-semialdehyde dehydrogenase [Mesotoga sp.]|jgi:glutamate-5-semialdehyde dehydrogenase|uniref:glutamate-5-semialdehyde dehydrogenase n=1 Tax=unclassified Mesotoga TaxID=1184398 RepID=UPI0025F8B6EF|nr:MULTISPECIES: glutamate-5-semialdehyde dehydrogenase [unclassified Mesotoga]HNU23174.1 glutamate-5-semialdehyde dehydrogenase [Mesotoga sp.]
MDLLSKGERVRNASRKLRLITTEEKNDAISMIAKEIEMHKDVILRANAVDVSNAREKGTKESLIDRLALSESRIQAMVQACREVIVLPDPVGEIESTRLQKDGLRISKERVPIGAIGMIFESRPNVTVDASILAIKSGNSILLKGGSDAINSNKAIVLIMKKALSLAGLPDGSIELVEDTSREVVKEMLEMNQYLSLIIPRGGAALIKFVVDNSRIPVIETGTGNCHIFVDYGADLEKSVSIVDNAKTQRPGTCNAVETLLVHRMIAAEFIPRVASVLTAKGVELRGCAESIKYWKMNPATEEDYFDEFLDLILAIKVVENVEEAMQHIEKYSSGHSESILTNDYSNSRQFLRCVDSAVVYVNASTRFTDGGEFGFGSEIGISTQKLHARGPFGLKELTSYKYTILGDYQVRK